MANSIKYNYDIEHHKNQKPESIHNLTKIVEVKENELMKILKMTSETSTECLHNK